VTEKMDCTKPRTGNLMLCECGHLKAFHFAQPHWYGGPLTSGKPCAHCKGAPADTAAAFGCQAFVPRADQAFTFLPLEGA